MEININIADYLSEEERQEIARECFRAELKKHFDSESEIQRILTNSCYYFMFDELAKIVPDYKEIMVNKTRELIEKKDLDYEVFHRKTSYGAMNDSAAISIIDSVAREMKDELKERVVNTIRNYDLEKFVSDAYGRSLYDLEQKYGEISEMFWKLRKTNSNIDVEKED